MVAATQAQRAALHTNRVELKAQARQIYVIFATIAALIISIWIALFTGASGA